MSHCHRLFAFVLFYFLLSKGNFLRKKKIILIDSFRILEKEKKKKTFLESSVNQRQTLTKEQTCETTCCIYC